MLYSRFIIDSVICGPVMYSALSAHQIVDKQCHRDLARFIRRSRCWSCGWRISVDCWNNSGPPCWERCGVKSPDRPASIVEEGLQWHSSPIDIEVGNLVHAFVKPYRIDPIGKSRNCPDMRGTHGPSSFGSINDVWQHQWFFKAGKYQICVTLLSVCLLREHPLLTYVRNTFIRPNGN